MTEAHPQLAGIGLALPPHVHPQERAAEALIELLGLDQREARRVRALHRRSRIEGRRSCLSPADHPLGIHGTRHELGGPAAALRTSERMSLYRQHAPALALEACRELFRGEGLPDRAAVSHVIAASCTGFLAPGLDVLLTRGLELPADVGRTLVGFQGCQAGLSSLRLADAICRADPGAAVLIACVELSTLHFQASAKEDDLLAGSLFADGAAAALVVGPELRSPGGLLIEETATLLHPDSLDDMTWEVGDHGFELHLSRLLPRLVGFDFLPFVEGPLGLGDPAERARHFWAVHPGGAAILDAFALALDLPPGALDASFRVLARCGNMSSATIWFVLQELLRTEALPERGLALAFGPGLSLEAARLKQNPARA